MPLLEAWASWSTHAPLGYYPERLKSLQQVPQAQNLRRPTGPMTSGDHLNRQLHLLEPAPPGSIPVAAVPCHGRTAGQEGV